MTTVYGWFAALCATTFTAIWVIEGHLPWGWGFCVLALFLAGCERVDLEAARRTITFMEDECDRLSARLRGKDGPV